MSKFNPQQPYKNLAFARFKLERQTVVKCKRISSVIGPNAMVLVMSVVPS